jgi:hypothetical protein
MFRLWKSRIFDPFYKRIFIVSSTQPRDTSIRTNWLIQPVRIMFDYPLPPYLARLIVSEDVFAAGFDSTKHDPNRLYQPIRPYGGIAWLGAENDKNSLTKWIENSRLPKAEHWNIEDFVVLRRVGALPNSADWTHNYSDPSNSIFSTDQIKAPLGLLWFGSQQINLDVLPRHAHGPVPHVVGGRLVIQGVNVLSARDVYTGQTLWKKTLKTFTPWITNLPPTTCGTGPCACLGSTSKLIC